MGKKLYVGNLNYNTMEDSLRSHFESFGHVESARIVIDRDTGYSKGFGFVEMSSETEALAAIAGTNEKELDGRTLRVNEAMDRPRENREDRGSRGFGRRNSYSYR